MLANSDADATAQVTSPDVKAGVSQPHAAVPQLQTDDPQPQSLIPQSEICVPPPESATLQSQSGAPDAAANSLIPIETANGVEESGCKQLSINTLAGTGEDKGYGAPNGHVQILLQKLNLQEASQHDRWSCKPHMCTF